MSAACGQSQCLNDLLTLQEFDALCIHALSKHLDVCCDMCSGYLLCTAVLRVLILSVSTTSNPWARAFIEIEASVLLNITGQVTSQEFAVRASHQPIARPLRVPRLMMHS